MSPFNKLSGRGGQPAPTEFIARSRDLVLGEGEGLPGRCLQGRRPVWLSDVADVVDDAENVQQAAWENERPAVILNVQRQPGSNIIGVVDRVTQLLDTGSDAVGLQLMDEAVPQRIRKKALGPASGAL